MDLKDEIIIQAPRETVFAALNDPDVLTEAIPGCQALEKISDNEFTATVVIKVGPVKASFKGAVTLSDIVAPEGYTISGGGKAGPAGFAKGSARVRLEEDPDGTRLTYEITAEVGGKLAQLGGRLMEATTKKLAGEFFQSFERIVVGEGAGEAPEPAAETPRPEVSRESPRESPRESQGNRGLVIAALCLAVMGMAAYLLLK
ncbi:MAG: carbon monoxide dehydrogenase subunit G [Proteobacteria bacterium]|nr:carbon monoxide dehydrogenase subunit G [Pseudomonadota bacterium]